MLPTAVLSGLLIVAAFRGRGNKEGAVQAITELEAAGLGVVREERATCGTAKVHLRTLNCMLPDKIVTYLYLYTVYILYMYMCMCIIMKLHPPPQKKTKQNSCTDLKKEWCHKTLTKRKRYVCCLVQIWNVVETV